MTRPGEAERAGAWRETSFAGATGLAEALLAQMEAGEIAEDEAEEEIAALCSAIASARGFFVALLTGPFSLAEKPPPSLLRALKRRRDVVCDLLTRDLVMSSAMAVHHRRRGDQGGLEGSLRVAGRTRALIGALPVREMRRQLRSILSSIAAGDGEYTGFLARWRYDGEQLAAAREAVEALL